MPHHAACTCGGRPNVRLLTRASSSSPRAPPALAHPCPRALVHALASDGSLHQMGSAQRAHLRVHGLPRRLASPGSTVRMEPDTKPRCSSSTQCRQIASNCARVTVPDGCSGCTCKRRRAEANTRHVGGEPLGQCACQPRRRPSPGVRAHPGLEEDFSPVYVAHAGHELLRRDERVCGLIHAGSIDAPQAGAQARACWGIRRSARTPGT